MAREGMDMCASLFINEAVDGKAYWFSRSLPSVKNMEDKAYLLPNYDEYTVAYKDRAALMDTKHNKKLDSRGNVLFTNVIILDGRIAGTWKRKIADTSGAPVAGSTGNPTDTLTPPGTYRITFDRRWIHDEFPCTDSPCTYVSSTGAGGEFDSDWDPGATTFHVQGEVTFRMFADTDRLAGWWCQTWGPAATYTWSVSGNSLKLAPVGGHDDCAIRGFVWSGTWTRAS